MYMNYLIFIFLFFSGFYVFISMRKHLLLTMLSLEFLIISIFYLFFIFIFYFYNFYYLLFFFLCFSVCESVLGLSILVSLIRCHGNDNMLNLSSLLW